MTPREQTNVAMVVLAVSVILLALGSIWNSLGIIEIKKVLMVWSAQGYAMPTIR